MDETREKVLERQVDAAAGKVKRLEEQMSAVVEILSRYANAELLHVTSRELGRLKCPASALAGAYEHGSARDTQVRTAAREAELDRLIAERQRQDRKAAQSRN